MKNFRDLKVWEKAHQLTLETYKITAEFPRHEMYSLTQQLRRASSSIAINIAEGCGRRGNGEFHRFLQIAAGSASEVEYELLLARDLGYMSSATHAGVEKDVVEIKRMLSGLINRVEAERLKI